MTEREKELTDQREWHRQQRDIFQGIVDDHQREMDRLEQEIYQCQEEENAQLEMAKSQNH